MTSEHTKEIDHAEVERIFGRLAMIAAGEPCLEAMAAVQDLYSAMLCIASKDKRNALALAENTADDILATIRKNFDWYKGQGASEHRSADA